jgi:hypothetical protein
MKLYLRKKGGWMVSDATLVTVLFENGLVREKGEALSLTSEASLTKRAAKQ